MPPNHAVTRLLIKYFHTGIGHQGRHLTHSKIRLNGYHILKGRSIIRKVVAGCQMCKRLRGPLLTQQMADLPKDRLEQVPPFVNSGLDVFGPFYVSERRSTRNSYGQRKVWVLILVCLVSRAVHVEILPWFGI